MPRLLTLALALAAPAHAEDSYTVEVGVAHVTSDDGRMARRLAGRLDRYADDYADVDSVNVEVSLTLRIAFVSGRAHGTVTCDGRTRNVEASTSSQTSFLPARFGVARLLAYDLLANADCKVRDGDED